MPPPAAWTHLDDVREEPPDRTDPLREEAPDLAVRREPAELRDRAELRECTDPL